MLKILRMSVFVLIAFLLCVALTSDPYPANLPHTAQGYFSYFGTEIAATPSRVRERYEYIVNNLPSDSVFVAGQFGGPSEDIGAKYGFPTHSVTTLSTPTNLPEYSPPQQHVPLPGEIRREYNQAVSSATRCLSSDALNCNIPLNQKGQISNELVKKIDKWDQRAQEKALHREEYYQHAPIGTKELPYQRSWKLHQID